MPPPDSIPEDKAPRSKKKRYRWAPVTLTALTVAATTGRYLLKRAFNKPLPRIKGAITVPGLMKSVEIIRDEWGVAHIYAENEEDLFFGQGFAQAQDRLFQLDINRRVGLGRMSELVGSPAIPSDRFARIFGWTRAAEGQLVGASDETRMIATSFSKGVNAFIAQKKLPAEFSLLAYRPEEWKPIDSAAWGVVLAWGLSVNWEAELLRLHLLEKIGIDKLADLTPEYKAEYSSVFPEDNLGNRLTGELIRAYQEAMNALPINPPFGDGIGSNNWVIHGSRTKSGRPILANDPHLPPVFPTIWYENHLVGGRYNVTGFTSPGIPGIIIGHNERIAWGTTNAFPDIQDLYIEEIHPQHKNWYKKDDEWVQAKIVTEQIKVRGRNNIKQKIRYTHNGPIISDLLPNEERPISLRWSFFESNDQIGSILRINRAQNWEQFQEALKSWAFPGQNLVYADVDNHIGFKMPGLVPIRGKGIGALPILGANSKDGWQKWIPFAELPTRFDPDIGYIVTANNRIAGDNYPYELTSKWLPSYRAQRITQLIEELTPHTVESSAKMQLDIYSIYAERFMRAAWPYLNQINLETTSPKHLLQKRALRLLREWDYTMHVDLAAPTIFYGMVNLFPYFALERSLGSELRDQLLGNGPLKEFPANSFHKDIRELTVVWLEKGAPDWIGAVQPILYQAFNESLNLLHKRLGPLPAQWKWGKIHTVKLDHHLVSVPGLGRLWKPMNLPIGGDNFTINYFDVPPQFPPEPARTIVSCRMILDVGNWDKSQTVLPGGQSGHPVSPHYQDGISDWLNGQYHPMPFSRAAVEEFASGIFYLQPE